jgi:DNA-binding GntR family transcriptional regulator
VNEDIGGAAMMIDEDRIVGVAMVTRKQLAADLGASRSAVNSAIRALIRHGYLVEVPGGFIGTMPHKEGSA